MKVNITTFAQKQWAKQMRLCKEKFGEKIAMKAIDKFEEKALRLSRFPEMGYPEPLLRNHRKFYRSVIINDHYKFVYYIEADCIWIVDFWDMRMSPENLKKRIKN